MVARGLALPVVTPVGGALLATVAALLVGTILERRDRRFVQEALGRYTSSALVAELVRHPEYLSLEWGEKRPMSVYFSDIAGFTTFSEALPPERLVMLLNEYLTEMTDLVLAHGGVVDKYIGDAVMAFFGAPVHTDQHAAHGCDAALEMIEALGRLRRTGFARGGISLDNPEESEEANFMADLISSLPSPEQSAARGELRRIMESAIDALPDAYRMAFILCGVEEMTVAETADCLDVEPATVKTRYHRARKLLQQQLSSLVDSTAVEVFPFDGERCDRIVSGVFRRLRKP